MSMVTLHIYDVGSDSRVGQLNEYLQVMGTGAFHGAVEVNGVEWSYGYNPDGTGVFCCEPKKCASHVYRESHEMGETEMTPEAIDKLILELKATWPGFEYDLLRHNCVVFSAFLIEQLGVGPCPPWVTNLAGAGATLLDGFSAGKEAVAPYAIIAAAKAGEINEKYDISGKAEAGAKQVLVAAGKFDEEYQIREKTFAAAALAQAKATEGAMAMHAEADGDGDGKLSQEELKNFFMKKAEAAPDLLKAKTWELKAGADAMAAAIQKAADGDGDGQVSFAEASNYLRERAMKFDSDYSVKQKAGAAAAALHAKAQQGMQAAKQGLQAAREGADVDGDGQVSFGEGQEYAKAQCGGCEGCVLQ